VNGGPRFCPLLIAKVTSEGQIEVGPVEVGRPAADLRGAVPAVKINHEHDF
jgi:hypothetical protein